MGINSKQLFLAGMFAAGAPFKSPEEYSPGQFKQLVMHHVRIDKVLTPFISTFEAPLSPIHRALHKQEGAIVTIFDSNKIQTPIYSAKSLVSNMEIRRSRYDGRTEYLIWGEILTEAIVATFKISELQRIATEDKEIGNILQLNQLSKRGLRDMTSLGTVAHNRSVRLSRQSGLSVGKLLQLLGISKIYVEEVATSIARSWQFYRRGAWDEYIHGVKEVFKLPLPQGPPMAQSTLVATPASKAHSKSVPIGKTIGEEVIIINSESDGESESDGMPDPAPTPCPIRRGANMYYTLPDARESLNDILIGPPRTSRRVEFFNANIQEWSTQRSMLPRPAPIRAQGDLGSRSSTDATVNDVDKDGNLVFMGENARETSDTSSSQNQNDTRRADQFDADRARVLHFLGSN